MHPLPQVLGNSALRISWGRSSSRAAHQAAQQAGPGFGGMPAPYPAGFDSAAAIAAGYQQLGAVPMPVAAYGPAAFAGAATASQQDLWVSAELLWLLGWACGSEGCCLWLGWLRGSDVA
jgi:hypothetical protein